MKYSFERFMQVVTLYLRKQMEGGHATQSCPADHYQSICLTHPGDQRNARWRLGYLNESRVTESRGAVKVIPIWYRSTTKPLAVFNLYDEKIWKTER